MAKSVATSSDCLHVVHGRADQPGHLARMRRDDDVALLAAGQASGIVGQHRERVRVEHQRTRRAIEQRAHELGDAGRAAQAGTAGDHVVRLLEQRSTAAAVTVPVPSSGRSTS